MAKILIASWKSRDSREGHFSEQRERFYQAAKKYNFEVVFFNPIGISSSTFLQFKWAVVLHRPDLIHFEWMHDVEEDILNLIEFLDAEDIPWSGLGSISNQLRSKNHDLDNEKLVRVISKSKSFKTLFIWDEFLEKSIKPNNFNLHSILDYQDNEIAWDHNDLCAKLVDLKSPVIGLVGQLYSYRGVTSLLLKRLFRRDFSVALIGKLYLGSFNLFQKWLLYFSLKFKWCVFEDMWIEGSSRLNHLICHLDGVYIDTRQYRTSSGIAIRARNCSVPVLIEPSNSVLNDYTHRDSGIMLFPKNLSDLTASNVNEHDQFFEHIKYFSHTRCLASIAEGWLKIT